MDGQRSFLQIPLRLDTRGLNELLVFRVVRYVGEIAEKINTTHPLEIYVNESVGGGQQAGGFWRSMLAQHDNQGHGPCYQQDADQEGESSSNAHRRMTAVVFHPERQRPSGEANDITLRVDGVGIGPGVRKCPRKLRHGFPRITRILEMSAQAFSAKN